MANERTEGRQALIANTKWSENDKGIYSSASRSKSLIVNKNEEERERKKVKGE